MIFQNIPVLDGNEKEYVVDCLDTNWISSLGKYVTEFEEYFSGYCNVSHGIACSNGTAAIHLALAGLGIGPGDEVLVPDFTLIADSNMVILAGAKPVFVDVDPATWCIDVDQIENKITDKTRAILCVHMYGHPCDMDKIAEIAQHHNLYVIEDAAQAHGTEYRSRKAGGLSDVACFSFYASKTLTTGEGGLVLTNDIEIAQRIKSMRSHGFADDGNDYVHDVFGFNYRLTNLQAAIGLAQCERIDEKVDKKRDTHHHYVTLLENESGVTLQTIQPWAKSTYWNTVILIEPEFGRSRDDVIKMLKEKRVQTRSVFKALHQQPVYAKDTDPRYPDISGHFPVSDNISEKGLCLPSSLNLTHTEIEEVVDKLLQCRQ